MKSLLISGTYYPPQVGGLSQFMSKLATTMGRERVCCLTGVSQDGRASAKEDGPRVYRFPTAFSTSRYVRALGWGAAITQIMVQERPQVTMLGTIDDGQMGLMLRRWLKLPLVVFAAGIEILDVIKEKWPKPMLALQTADRVIAISRYTASLVERGGVDPSRIEIVYPGYDTSRFRPLEESLELRQKLLGDRYKDQVILTVGNLVARKGHDTTISALPSLLRRVPDVTYLIVGDGPYRNQLETLATKLGVRNRVIFAGRLADDDLADLYALCDVFVMPSRAQLDEKDVEGFGIVFLEASACAKPVIGGRSGGVPEAIIDGVTGLLVDPNNPDELSDAIARLLTDREFANRLGQQGRVRAVNDFSWGRAADRIQVILDSVKREQVTL
jgi:phosphatidyl-myo-inositol dimannoside synthase